MLKDKERPTYWGTVDDRPKKEQLPRNSKIYNIADDLRGSYGGTLTNLIIKEHSYVNSEVVNNAFLKPI